MYSNLMKHRENITVLALLTAIVMMSLSGRFGSLMLFCSKHYSATAEDLHRRECTIRVARGCIIDANGVVVADNRTVHTISAIYNQVKNREQVIRVLCDELDPDEELVRKRVGKHSSREIIKTNVDKELGNQIRSCRLAGIKVDEDYKRYYPCGGLVSKVLGFTGGDNQGIISLEVKYGRHLKRMNGRILTMSDTRDVEIKNAAEDGIEPIPGNDLHISPDTNIQEYAEQLAYQVLEKKNTRKVSIIVMNPQNGELVAMVNVPESNLNDPSTLSQDPQNRNLQELVVGNQGTTGAGKQKLLNQIWKNTCVNDTYKPGSTFKIVTVTASLESGVVKLTDQFSYPGFRVAEDWRMRCHKVGGHGAETSLQGAMNSYNPVFIDMGQCLGVNGYYKYLTQFGPRGETEINLPGETATTMHKKENMGLVELAMASFGQSFQITPVQLTTMTVSIIDGGNRVTPHFGVGIVSTDDISVHKLDYSPGGRVLSEGASATMRYVLEQVILERGGEKVKLEGHRIGGKAATSKKLPRSLKKYISSFIGFALADSLQVMALITIDEPEGTYCDGTIAAPAVGDPSKGILPYLGTEVAQGETAVHLSNPQLIIPGKRRIPTIR